MAGDFERRALTKRSLRTSLPTIIAAVALIAVIAISRTPADADLLHAQILVPAGGKIIIDVSPNQAYSGTISFAASNILSGTAVSLQGNAEPLPLIAPPSASSMTLYSILLILDPHYPSQFTTAGPSTLDLSLPATVDTTKPLSVYETQFIAQPPKHVVWTGPFVGSVAGKICSFSLPSLSFAGNSAVVFYVTQ